MALLFSWNDSYNTGISRIDTQHKQLVDLLNTLYDAMGKGKGSDVLGKLLDDLIRYTVIHFGTEERLFDEFGYPQTAAHKKEHDYLTSTAKQLQKDFKAGKITISMQVATFLKGWLMDHILGADKKYAPFLLSKGVK